MYYGINATYNYLAFFFLILLLFLENKYKDKDYLIGIVIALAILSKQTVGVLLIIPSLIYYFKYKNKLLKRFIGLIGVVLVFIIYLLITNSFNSFIDLCFLGLFDFSKKNSNTFTIWFFISIILFIISIIITIKNKKDIKNIYLLFGISFVVPLFDLCHFSLYIMCITIQLLPFIKKYENYLGFLGYTLAIIATITNYINLNNEYKPLFNKGIKHFEYINNGKYNYDTTIKYFELFDEYQNALILSYSKMQYDISRDNNIDYFDVLLYGNYGYDGTNKMIEKIKNMHDRYVIIDERGYLDNSSDSQFDKTIVEYVMNNYNQVDTREEFLIYYID
jgi:4-amino-4-deoxy-L-arabinose transferase-like glycosyltransferase